MISLDSGRLLVQLARESIVARLEGKEPVVPDDKRRLGVFVTLTIKGELRGCIGFTEPVMPLSNAVSEAACAAAFSDPRFPPLEKREIDSVQFEVSVLTKPDLIKVDEAAQYPDRICIGRDGLIIKCGPRSGLLLPQVAVEHGFDSSSFLASLCRKAGLPQNAWHLKESKIYRFQAQIFSEEKGTVVERRLG
jgi:uncharacterized protein